MCLNTNVRIVGADWAACISAWHLPGGPVGPSAMWAAMSNVEGGSGTEEEARGLLARERWLYLDKLFAAVPDFLVTPLLMGMVCLISQGRFEEPVRPKCIRYVRAGFSACDLHDERRSRAKV